MIEASPSSEFPEQIFCHQCRRTYPIRLCQARTNILLTETQLSCPRCRRRLKTIRLKDWYDHYVQGDQGNTTPSNKL